MRNLPAESETGNVEYKLTLSDKSADKRRIEELASQMRFRLYEGSGEAIYYLGVTDDGVPEGISPEELETSLSSLREVAEAAGAKIQVLRRGNGNSGSVAEVLVRQVKNPDEIPLDIRIASIGNVDAGKSTLIGVLLNGELDDGRGSARSKVVRYLHELETGRTSSVGITVLGFNIEGKPVNHDAVHPPTDLELLERSVKTVTFLDLAGHEKYLKTTVFGLTGLSPNYGMLIVSANQGVLQMTKEHLGLVIALKIPFFVVLTKIDMTPAPRTKRTIRELKKLLKIPGVSKIPMAIAGLDDVVLAASNMLNNSIVPIFKVSAVEGTGIDLLLQFLQLLPAVRKKESSVDAPFKAYIDDIFLVPGVGTVVAVIVYSGKVFVNDLVQIGPFDDGSFREVRIKSIHYKRVPTEFAIAGQNATFALAKFSRSDVRKGMTLLGLKYEHGAVYEFEAEVYVLYHSTTIRPGYSPVIHIRTIRQSAQILEIDQKLIRTGDRATVRFRFLYRPEYIQEGQRLVFREGRTKGIGIVTRIFPSTEVSNS